MKSQLTRLLSIPLILLVAAASNLVNADEIVVVPEAELFEDVVILDAAAIAGFQSMNIRLYDSKKRLLSKSRLFTPIYEIPADTLDDGFYQYELVVISTVSDRQRQEQKARGVVEPATETIHRKTGQFEVLGGKVVGDEAGRMIQHTKAQTNSNRTPWQPERWLATVVASVAGFLVSDAIAEDLTITDWSPNIDFDSTQDPAPAEWRILGHPTQIYIHDLLGEELPFIIKTALDSDSNFYSDVNGDVFLANYAVHIDRFTQRMGLGAWPAYPLDISNAAPAIRLLDETDSSEMILEFDGGALILEGNNSQQDIASISMSAPAASFVIVQDGDIGLGQGSVIVDAGNKRLSVGGLLPQYPLHVSNAKPELHFTDLSDNSGMGLEFNLGVLRIEGNLGEQDIVSINMNAPQGALSIDNTGRVATNKSVGIGTYSPSQALHVRRTDGSAQVFVEDTDGSATPKTLFKLKSNFNAKFEIENTDGATWAFTNAGTDFRISRQGSGVVEFSVANNGNATLSGALTQNSDVHAKQAIVPVNAGDILDKVAALPISQWQYKDDAGVNHIGPMAQDFHATFGLGANDTGISTIDTAGVALAAIQALAAENAELRNELKALKAGQQDLQLVLAGMMDETPHLTSVTP